MESRHEPTSVSSAGPVDVRVPAPPAWDAAALADPHQQPDKARRVEGMFNAIAGTYECVNRFASLGQDTGWRRRAIAMAELRQGEIALDICCGTGDMVRLLAQHHPRPKLVLGIDFAANMLAHGRYDALANDAAPHHLLRGDGQRLPLRDASVDLTTCAFGVRNFQHLPAGLREMRRVLRPGGRAVILEFASPKNTVIRWGYRLYTERVLPRMAEWLSRDRSGAYRYLQRSIEAFARPGEMIDALLAAGFERVRRRALNLGSVMIYRADVGSG
jgi:demethylmenaquinone methyltransferase/2-methoxy-6-polyprenyl-1,4-benzoquinol methylase